MLNREALGRWLPEHPLLRALCQAKESCALLPQVVAVAEGLRPACDDWVPMRSLQTYRSVAARLGLSVVPDVAFAGLPSSSAVGHGRLTTTRTLGRPVSEAGPDDRVHVFLARNAEALDAVRRWGWYPVEVDGVIVPAGLADAPRFGRAMGYPPCCVQSFLANNRWSEVGHLHRLGSPGSAWWGLNFLPRHLGFGLIFHIPCSWRCAPSTRLAKATMEALKAMEPAYAALAEAAARTPTLFASERVIYLLFSDEDGRLRPMFAGGDPVDEVLGERLEGASRLVLQEGWLGIDGERWVSPESMGGACTLLRFGEGES